MRQQPKKGGDYNTAHQSPKKAHQPTHQAPYQPAPVNHKSPLAGRQQAEHRPQNEQDQVEGRRPLGLF